MTAGWSRASLVVAAGFAVIVEGFGILGWQEWRSVEELASTDPTAAAQRLTDDAVVSLPSGAAWLTRLTGRDLAHAAATTAAAGWRRVGVWQCRWLPTDPHGFTNLARAAVLEHDGSRAASLVAQAIARDPTSPYLLRVAAAFDLEAGHYDAALDHLATAEAVAPGYKHPAVEVIPGDDDWVRLEGLRRRAALYPAERTETLLRLAGELRRQGRQADAESALAPVREAPAVAVQLARWALEDGRTEDATTLAAGLAERRGLPTSLRVQAFSVLAMARAVTGDEQGADRAAAEALRLGPDSPAPYLALARMAESRGDAARALELLRRAWGVAPTDLGVLLAVARVAEKADSPRDARLALERAVEVAPDRADVGATLVQYLLQHHDYMEAALRLSHLLDRFPTDSRLLALAGRLEGETTAHARRAGR